MILKKGTRFFCSSRSEPEGSASLSLGYERTKDRTPSSSHLYRRKQNANFAQNFRKKNDTLIFDTEGVPMGKGYGK